MPYTAYPYQILTVAKGLYNNEQFTGGFYLNRSYVWKRNGVLTDVVGSSYLTRPSDVGSSITCQETVWRTAEPNDGFTYQAPSNTTVIETPAVSVVAGGTAISGALYPENITYVGTFAAPTASDGEFGLYAAGIGQSGATKTIMYVGNRTVPQRGRQITIPSDGQLVDAFSVPAASLNRTLSSVINTTGATELLEGQLAETGATSNGIGGGSGTTGSPNRGLFRVGATSKVIMSALNTYSYNDIGYVWRRPLDFSITGQVEGPVQLVQTGVTTNARQFAGYMCSVAPENQAALGGDILIGVCGLSVVSTTSDGPSVMSLNSSTFDAAFAKRLDGTVQATSTVTEIQLDSSASATAGAYIGWKLWIPEFSAQSALYITAYSASKRATVSGWGAVPTTGGVYKLIPPLESKALCAFGLDGLAVLRGEELSPIWAYNNVAVGMCQPSGSKSVVCFGVSGQGIWVYNANGEITGPDGYQGSYIYNGPKIYDSDMQTRGPHQFPNSIRVWGYNTDDLALVASGSVAYNQVKPYAVWNMTMPYSQNIRNAVYDDATKRLYIIQSNETTPNAGAGVIHVYQITT
jgi:hypothetical protein